MNGRESNPIKHIFIINPASGKGVESKPLSEAVRDACAAAGEVYEIYMTSGVGDAADFVRRKIAEKPSGELWRFYACGGDGTLSEVVDSAANPEGGRPFPGVEIGLVPIGTGNDFVRNFSQPEFFRDITKQLLADAMEIDCYRCEITCEDGRLDIRHAVNMINIGFDCDVCVKTAELKKKKWLPKSLAYIAGIVVTLKKNLGRVITVRRSDGSVTRHEFELVSAANGGWCGGGFHSAPHTSITDGLMDISLIKKVSRTTFLRLVGAYKKGTHLKTRLGKKIVAYMQDSSVTFEPDAPTSLCIDGEIFMAAALTLTAVPKALAFAVPVGSELIPPNQL